MDKKKRYLSQMDMAEENKKKCIIVVPVHKEHLSDDEKASLIQLREVMGGRWDVSLVCPELMDVASYKDLWLKDRELGVERFPKEWFKSQSSYAKFMTLPYVYKRFCDYEFMLIYQLDAWIFRDELEEWISKGYDYIGAPFLSFRHMVYERRCENGGFCLRRISSMLRYIESNDDSSLDSRYWDDGFYCYNYGGKLKIAPMEDAVLFSLEAFPDRFYGVTKKLPFGCHAWRRYNYDFWKDVIDVEKNLNGIKSNDIRFFCFSHKVPDVAFDNDRFHTPVEVGSALRETHFGEILDNDGDNISDKNLYWRELTGIYYLWKNVHDVKYIGTEHYGRRFNFSVENVLTLFEKGDVEVICHAITLNETVEEHYKISHSEYDFSVMENVVKEMYPDYADSFDKFLKKDNTLLANNNFVMSKENFDKMWRFVFSVIEETLKRLNVSSLEDAKQHVAEFAVKKSPYGDWVDYQAAFPGFMAERLSSLYVRHNFSKVKVAEYKKI